MTKSVYEFFAEADVVSVTSPEGEERPLRPQLRRPNRPLDLKPDTDVQPRARARTAPVRVTQGPPRVVTPTSPEVPRVAGEEPGTQKVDLFGRLERAGLSERLKGSPYLMRQFERDETFANNYLENARFRQFFHDNHNEGVNTPHIQGQSEDEQDYFITKRSKLLRRILDAKGISEEYHGPSQKFYRTEFNPDVPAGQPGRWKTREGTDADADLMWESVFRKQKRDADDNPIQEWEVNRNHYPILDDWESIIGTDRGAVYADVDDLPEWIDFSDTDTDLMSTGWNANTAEYLQEMMDRVEPGHDALRVFHDFARTHAREAQKSEDQNGLMHTFNHGEMQNQLHESAVNFFQGLQEKYKRPQDMNLHGYDQLFGKYFTDWAKNSGYARRAAVHSPDDYETAQQLKMHRMDSDNVMNFEGIEPEQIRDLIMDEENRDALIDMNDLDTYMHDWGGDGGMQGTGLLNAIVNMHSSDGGHGEYNDAMMKFVVPQVVLNLLENGDGPHSSMMRAMANYERTRDRERRMGGEEHRDDPTSQPFDDPSPEQMRGRMLEVVLDQIDLLTHGYNPNEYIDNMDEPSISGRDKAFPGMMGNSDVRNTIMGNFNQYDSPQYSDDKFGVGTAQPMLRQEHDSQKLSPVMTNEGMQAYLERFTDFMNLDPDDNDEGPWRAFHDWDWYDREVENPSTGNYYPVDYEGDEFNPVIMHNDEDEYHRQNFPPFPNAERPIHRGYGLHFETRDMARQYGETPESLPTNISTPRRDMITPTALHPLGGIHQPATGIRTGEARRGEWMAEARAQLFNLADEVYSERLNSSDEHELQNILQGSGDDDDEDYDYDDPYDNDPADLDVGTYSQPGGTATGAHPNLLLPPRDGNIIQNIQRRLVDRAATDIGRLAPMLQQRGIQYDNIPRQFQQAADATFEKQGRLDARAAGLPPELRDAPTYSSPATEHAFRDVHSVFTTNEIHNPNHYGTHRIPTLDTDLRNAGLTRNDLNHAHYIAWHDAPNHGTLRPSFMRKHGMSPDEFKSNNPDYRQFVKQAIAFNAIRNWKNRVLPSFSPGDILYNTPIRDSGVGNMREVLYSKMGFGRDGGPTGQQAVIGPDGRAYPLYPLSRAEEAARERQRRSLRGQRNIGEDVMSPLGELKFNIEDELEYWTNQHPELDRDTIEELLYAMRADTLNNSKAFNFDD